MTSKHSTFDIERRQARVTAWMGLAAILTACVIVAVIVVMAMQSIGGM
jgi:hypothetical protein